MNATKQQIIDAFERHVAEHGYAHANLDQVAAELKISKKTIYVHFDGKRDIYAHVVTRQAQGAKRRLVAAVAPLPDYASRVEVVVRSVLELSRTHILETSEEEWLREYEVAADAFREATGDVLRELVQGGMAAGEFRAGDAVFVEKMVAAMILEYTKAVNADPSYDHDAELVERIVRFVS